MNIDNEVIDAIKTLYITNKLLEDGWNLLDTENTYPDGNTFKTLMLSNESDNYLMIAYNNHYVEFLLSLDKSEDFEVIKWLDKYRKMYSANLDIHRDGTYFYKFRFLDFDLFHSFFKKVIMPKMGFDDNELKFSWI